VILADFKGQPLPLGNEYDCVDRVGKKQETKSSLPVLLELADGANATAELVSGATRIPPTSGAGAPLRTPAPWPRTRFVLREPRAVVQRAPRRRATAAAATASCTYAGRAGSGAYAVLVARGPCAVLPPQRCAELPRRAAGAGRAPMAGLLQPSVSHRYAGRSAALAHTSLKSVYPPKSRLTDA
jgi:hypothetical protein